MTRRRPRAGAALAAEAWRRLFHFFISTRAQRDEVLARHGLTPNDIRALAALSGSEGRTMRSLAEEWGCDASNATWIVDRLVKRRLARRSTPTSDRRLKHIVLTGRGERTRRKVFRALDRPPPEFRALDARRLHAIRDALEGIRGARARDGGRRGPAAGGARPSRRLSSSRRSASRSVA